MVVSLAITTVLAGVTRFVQHPSRHRPDAAHSCGRCRCCWPLFPSDISEYAGWGDYFISRRRWFFALLALSIVFDAVDSLLKGRGYFAAFGIEYPIRIAAYLALAGVAAWTPNRRFHLMLAAANLAYQVSWILRSFDTLR